jgi:hypothetical protein
MRARSISWAVGIGTSLQRPIESNRETQVLFPVFCLCADMARLKLPPTDYGQAEVADVDCGGSSREAVRSSAFR